ncbi:EF2563 family selenium-dependent molybdenum hydroxylase system protein [Tissierella carlieri]|uniref:Selenium-dependent molybdenum cofactor biosynthesis protein YqeB n=1 Tax=Tissierella carlieri TaxID=689904 RepID=A0ABT1SH48_9FIRM|nr:selenium-dependent molybdenum cofactor biosynthesis protein YqeB [Tissierella carlieri]MBU5312744.1 EF2563 family selenium-dependent molybdenum hydroxylase system protein [Tissierella carlieri]MCQ4925821.1 selenium-dependent molybdenum cofactor biosynthesis protein YqeB [Tissierella carlieri]MDU5083287.1 selenium-dependent molybdenum cofactor biosynthesis protein YqeB [Bacillota bacterium]
MELIIIRGGGDIATGIGHRLFMAGFKVIILDMEKPLAIRRRVSFCEAVYNGEIIVEGVKAILTRNLEEIYEAINNGIIPVYIDGKGEIINSIKPIAIIDSILAKKNLGTTKDMAPMTIGIGPGFEAGVDVDLVVETKRGHFLGKVIYKGKAEDDTGIPGDILGYKEERIIRAEASGIFKSYYNIGDKVEVGDIICETSGRKVRARISGILRGIIKEGLYVEKGLKVGDIDPRGIEEYVYTISDKARAVGGGVLEGIMYLRKGRRI